MRKYIVLVAALAFCLVYGQWAFGATNYVYSAKDEVGGSAGDLDNIDGTDLVDDDSAIMMNATNTFFYKLDDDLSGTEANPSVINPDSNAGTKSWVLAAIVPPIEPAVYTSAHTWTLDHDGNGVSFTNIGATQPVTITLLSYVTDAYATFSALGNAILNITCVSATDEDIIGGTTSDLTEYEGISLITGSWAKLRYYNGNWYVVGYGGTLYGYD